MSAVIEKPVPQPTKAPTHLTVIADRSPRQKLHANRGHARNAIAYRWYFGRADCDMELWRWDNDGWVLEHTVKKGDTTKPWDKK